MRSNFRKTGIKYFFIAALIVAAGKACVVSASASCVSVDDRPAPFFASGITNDTVKKFRDHEVTFFASLTCVKEQALEAEISTLSAKVADDGTSVPLKNLLSEKQNELAGLRSSENYLWKQSTDLACSDVNFDEFKDKFDKYDVDKKREYEICIYKLRSGLVEEKNTWDKAGKKNAKESAEADLKDIEEQMTLVEAGVTKKEKFSDEDYVKVFSEDNWYSAFHLGAKFMPKYDSEGNNEGFEETNFFGRFVIDSRTEWSKRRATHIGFNADFTSAHIINCKKIQEGSDDEAKENCQEKKIESLNFNDISNSVNASVYGWLNFKCKKEDRFEWGPGLKYAMQSREKLGENGDAINIISSYGWRFVFNDFSQYCPKCRNGMPRFFIEFTSSKFDDYAGLGRSERRKVASAAYRVRENVPIYVGLYANGGKGPDEIALTLTYGLNTERITNFF